MAVQAPLLELAREFYVNHFLGSHQQHVLMDRGVNSTNRFAFVRNTQIFNSNDEINNDKIERMHRFIDMYDRKQLFLVS